VPTSQGGSAAAWRRAWHWALLAFGLAGFGIPRDDVEAAPATPRERAGIVYHCSGGASFRVRFESGVAVVTAGGRTHRLPARRSSIGRKYNSDNIYFIQDEDRAVLVGAGGGPYTFCVQA
jgi:hypothetical protein